MSRTTEIADTIAEQLCHSEAGIQKIARFTGAKNFVALNETPEREGGLQFRFPGSTAANTIAIELKWDDTYLVKFYKIRGTSSKLVKEVGGAYCDDLKSIFEDFTAVYLSF